MKVASHFMALDELERELVTSAFAAGGFRRSVAHLCPGGRARVPRGRTVTDLHVGLVHVAFCLVLSPSLRLRSW